MVLYSSLNIGRICYKENHHVNSLGLNGSKIHAIYLVELRKEMTWCNAHDAMMNAKNQTNHTTKPGNPGRHLKLRSWGVTTLHHYERISSRDLGWHRRENGRGREHVKLSCFLDKWMKPWTLRGWTNWKKEYNEEDKVEKHSVRKEGQGRTNSDNTSNT